ncbi:MAG: heme exporter protein CcmD [Alphaproteobacteria bacterium]|nr:heme exporter protein CcmD [Alphaproteobacteria bacterium]
MSDFMAMGGYGGFIWTAYGAVAFVLGGLLIISLRENRATAAEVAALEANSPRRRNKTDKEDDAT